MRLSGTAWEIRHRPQLRLPGPRNGACAVSLLIQVEEALRRMPENTRYNSWLCSLPGFIEERSCGVLGPFAAGPRTRYPGAKRA